MDNIFKGFHKIRGYIAVMLSVFTFYVYATFKGCYMLGDDNQVKEERSSQAHGRYYHK